MAHPLRLSSRSRIVRPRCPLAQYRQDTLKSARVNCSGSHLPSLSLFSDSFNLSLVLFICPFFPFYSLLSYVYSKTFLYSRYCGLFVPFLTLSHPLFKRSFLDFLRHSSSCFPLVLFVIFLFFIFISIPLPLPCHSPSHSLISISHVHPLTCLFSCYCYSPVRSPPRVLYRVIFPGSS